MTMQNLIQQLCDGDHRHPDANKIYVQDLSEEYCLEVGLCPICLQELESVRENTGFNEPDPTHYEIVGYKPCSCTKSY